MPVVLRYATLLNNLIKYYSSFDFGYFYLLPNSSIINVISRNEDIIYEHEVEGIDSGHT